MKECHGMQGTQAVVRETTQEIRSSKDRLTVKDASSTQTYSFLPASWEGDTHEETDILPIGDQEEKGKGLLNRRTDSLGTMQVLRAKYLADRAARG